MECDAFHPLFLPLETAEKGVIMRVKSQAKEWLL